VFDRTAQEVERLSNGRQRPREEIGLRGRFVMTEGRAALAVTPAPPTAQTSGVTLADLEREAQVQQQWAAWQQRMQSDFDRVAGFQAAAGLRVEAWQRFLGAWKDDNPTSGDDERLRDQAQQRLATARQEVQTQRPSPAGATARVSGSSGTAGAGGAWGAGGAGWGAGGGGIGSGAAGGAWGAGGGGMGSGIIGTAPPGQTFKDCAECPEMVVIPAGRFLMGSPESEPGRSGDEGPQRWVDVPRFAMGKFEVTQGQWQAVMGSNPSWFKACGANCPVETVSWNDAQEFVRRLSQRTGQTYRLPSEAEWEYAARAGTTTTYFWGDRFDGNQANNSSRTVRVGSYLPNAFGLYDMQGNVWEWVQDVWHDSYAGSPIDGSAWMTGGDPTRRVLRGGSWNGAPRDLRSADRSGDSPGSRGSGAGFRIARTF
jgi:formylglycine-generating enzyme required for sulfatase activity